MVINVYFSQFTLLLESSSLRPLNFSGILPWIFQTHTLWVPFTLIEMRSLGRKFVNLVNEICSAGYFFKEFAYKFSVFPIVNVCRKIVKTNFDSNINKVPSVRLWNLQKPFFCLRKLCEMEWQRSFKFAILLKNNLIVQTYFNKLIDFFE